MTKVASVEVDEKPAWGDERAGTGSPQADGIVVGRISIPWQSGNASLSLDQCTMRCCASMVSHNWRQGFTRASIRKLAPKPAAHLEIGYWGELPSKDAERRRARLQERFIASGKKLP
eukprot:6474238-Prymnesium_polylepis.2